MIDISIILPSMRPYMLYNCIDRIDAYTTNKISYEIIVVSGISDPKYSDLKFLDIFDNLIIIKENNPEGVHRAIKRGVNGSNGKYIMTIADYHLIESNCLENIVSFMNNHDNELIISNPKYHHILSSDPECYLWNYYYARTPCIKKENLDKIGEFYSTEFVSYYGDVDLSLRVLEKGGRVCICPDAWIYHSETWELPHTNPNFENDSITFRKKWETRHIPISGNMNEIKICDSLTFSDYKLKIKGKK